jgi:hypothetical protein
MEGRKNIGFAMVEVIPHILSKDAYLCLGILESIP